MTEEEISRQITRYINGELSDREEDLLWVEFLKNQEYFELFETELNLTDLYRNKNFRIDESGNSNHVNEPERRYLPWAASIAAAILLSSMLYLFSFQNENTPASYALPNISTTQMLGSDIFRNESPDVIHIDQQINRALSLALAGNNDQATELLSGLLSESPTDKQEVRILFNLGILAYNDESLDQSLDRFTQVLELDAQDVPDFIYDNIKWYTANIFLKQGDRDQSEQLLRQIASGDGIHAEKAEELLSDLDN